MTNVRATEIPASRLVFQKQNSPCQTQSNESQALVLVYFKSDKRLIILAVSRIFSLGERSNKRDLFFLQLQYLQYFDWKLILVMFC